MIRTTPIHARIPTAPARLRRIEVLMMEDIGDRVEEKFKETVATWKRQPYFFKTVEVLPDRIVLKVYTTDDVYRYVSRGTKPHRIPLVAAGQVLRFRQGYVAKTVPGILTAGPGGSFGAYRFFTAKTKFIHHPGIKHPRNFPKTVRKETKQYISDRFGKMGHRLKMELSR